MKTILLVDDNREHLEVLTFLLEDEGFQVKALTTAVDIYTVIENFKPKLIFLDVMLDGENGMEICSRLKSDPSIASIKIVLMTASLTFQKLHQIVARADHYLPKPFDFEEVIRLANEFVAK
ncbi:MAG: response regulator [Chitinophagaceae bacterium]|nr:MAG: response regulator [Chitinophagaceae bacterium]